MAKPINILSYVRDYEERFSCTDQRYKREQVSDKFAESRRSIPQLLKYEIFSRSDAKLVCKEMNREDKQYLDALLKYVIFSR